MQMVRVGVSGPGIPGRGGPWGWRWRSRRRKVGLQRTEEAPGTAPGSTNVDVQQDCGFES